MLDKAANFSGKVTLLVETLWHETYRSLKLTLRSIGSDDNPNSVH
ncbi:MAG TPA: hypothetical protein V6C84_22055 [Coleofasciculaceae cyanobacterium]